MRRLLVTLLAIISTCGAGAAEPTAAERIQKGQELFKEQSYQLALEEFEAVAADESAPPAAAREAAYMRGRSLMYLNRDADSLAGLEKLATPPPDDIWAARANWQWAVALSRSYTGQDERTTVIRLLKRAEESLGRLGADDMAAFYGDITETIINRTTFETEEDRAYVYSAFDKRTPLLKSPEAIAANALGKADKSAYVSQKQDDEKWVAAHRTVYKEFPDTAAAGRAMLAVGNYFMNRQDLVSAESEYKMLVSRHGGTDEAKTAQSNLDQIRQRELSFVAREAVAPGAAVELQVMGRNIASAEIEIIPFDPLDTLRRHPLLQFDLAAVRGETVETKGVQFEVRSDFKATSKTIEIKMEKAGAYVLRGRAGSAQCNALLVVSDMMLVGNSGASGVEMWVVDAETGKPREGVEVLVASKPETRNRLLGLREQTEFTRFETLKTDRDGFATFEPGDNNAGQVMAVARQGESFAVFITNSHYRHRESGEFRTYVYTDRPVYRPSEKVFWRAILRNRQDGKYSEVEGRSYDVRITDARGQEVWKKDGMAASQHGALHGELELSDSPALGMYSISVKDASRGHAGGGNFRVEEYKKPEYEVTVSTGEGMYKLGSRVSATVKATYYFGAPVADAEVQYTVRRRPRPYWIWPRHGLKSGASLAWFDTEEQRDPVMHGSSGDIIANGSGRTDESGNFNVEFEAQKPANEAQQPPQRYWWGGWTPAPPSYDFQVEVTVTDASRRNIDGSRTVTVGEKALNLRVSTQRRIYAPNDIVTAELSSSNLSGDPLPSSGTLYVERLEWVADLAEEKITTVSTQAAETGTIGAGTMRWRAEGVEPGRYRLLLEAGDPFGGKSYGSTVIVVADETTKDIAVKYQGIEMTADKETYEPGEPVRLLVTSEFTAATGWLWVDTGTGNIEKKIISLPERTNFVMLPVTDAYVPNVRVNLVVVQAGEVFQAMQNIIVPPLKRVLTVELTADRETYKPRSEGTLKLRVTDHEGKPVAGEFSLSVFDKSVLYIAPDTRTDIRREFYGQQRGIWSSIGQSTVTPGGYTQTIPERLWFYGAQDPHAFYPRSSMRYLERRSSAGREEKLFATEASVHENTKAAMAGAPMAQVMSKSAADATVSEGDVWRVKKDGDAGQGAAMQPAELRTDFRDSIHWSPSILTNENGEAEVKVTFPDSLTTWQADTIGISAEDSLVGEAQVSVVTKKNLLVRLETPRFFRERDTVTISAIVHNYLASDKQAAVKLTVDGLALDTAPEQRVSVPSNGEVRCDWTISVKKWGEATLRAEALTDEESDAVELKKPVLPHGIDKFVAWNGASDMPSTVGLTTAQAVESGTTVTRITQTVTVPEERIISSSRLTVLITPSLAMGIRDALPYMIEYPYGCVEQTMSRFLPAAVAAKTFEDLGISKNALLEDKLPDVLKAGAARLASMQRSSGGWGWWQNDEENPYITAFVMHGLSVARQAGVEGDDAMFQRGLGSVRASVANFRAQDSAGNYWRNNSLHTLALQTLVLALNNEYDERAILVLWERRAELSPHGLAMLARTLKRSGRGEQAAIALRNLHNFAVVVDENNTAHWGRVRGAWYWWDDAVEATAQGLMAHLEIEPSSPMAARAAKWLVLNREGRQWKSTKDTAAAVLALSSYMKQRGESAAAFEVEVTVAGGEAKSFKVTPDNFWDFDGRIVLEGDAVPSGDFPVAITHRGTGTLYYSVFAEYFTLEEGIKSAGNEIFVERIYSKLSRKDVDSTDVVARDEYEPLADGAELVSGDEIRVTLRIRSLNDYEYLVFEDAKPAGCEPVALQSGTVYAGFCSNMELRDELVAFFVTHLPQGEHVITYDMRAEIPGTFHTMPTRGYAMYTPLLRANSDEIVIKVADRP